MTTEPTFLAIDLGAESGRVLAASLKNEQVQLQEIHRFANVPVELNDGLYWNILGIFAEVKEGLRKAGERVERLSSIGVDSWAVDFGLLDREGALLANPHNYRDPRTEGMIERAFERMPQDEIYRTTGIQFIRINTLYQLLAMEKSPLLQVADRLLLIPDLISYWLTGRMACELTNATTTQLYDQQTGDWDWKLLNEMSLPTHVFPEIVSPATQLGRLLPEVAQQVGLSESVPIISVGSHDTASAVAAVPAEGDSFAYISSGTWSLVGIETPEPVITQEALDLNFTNEGGVGGRTRFLKNVMGLWLLQECRRTWAEEGYEHSYEELERLSREAKAFGSVVDTDHRSFFSPGEMPSRIRDFCEKTGQKTPEGPGQVARCVFESLALKYAIVLEQAARLGEQSVETVHVVGGGSQNSLLCQLTADATGLPVLAGPVEATALGNAMVQALAGGYVDSLQEIRAIIRRSSDVVHYVPGEATGEWAELRERFGKILEAGPIAIGEDQVKL